MKRSVLVGVSLIAVMALCCGCASVLLGVGMWDKRSPAKVERQREKGRKRWAALVPGIIAWEDSLKAAGVMRDTGIVVDGCRLHSIYVPAGKPCRRSAIVVHGFKASPENVMMLVRMYRDSLGFNVLAPSLRHHGYSEGEYVQMGWGDRLDILRWSALAHGIFGDTLQVFHGESMGAATVMMASGEPTPEYVRGFIEDCGYTTAWEEMVYCASKFLKRDSLVVSRAEKLSVARYGVNIHEVSSLKQLEKCGKPMLFIHGSADELVPVEMAYRNFEAKSRGYRELWIAPGSAHSRSYPDHPAEYTSRVRKFLEDRVLTYVPD